MSTVVILGCSPMVDDIRPYLIEHRVLNRNTDEEPSIYENAECLYVSCIGSPRSYLSKLKAISEANIKGNLCDLIIKDSAHIYHDGNGNLIFPSFISKSARFGKHCLIMPNATIHHGCQIGSGSNIASNVVLNGDVTLKGSCFIGAGSVIKEKVTICKDVLVGANAYVNRDIVKSGIYFGNPAREIDSLTWVQDEC